MPGDPHPVLMSYRDDLLRNDAYIVQVLDGYTDGHASWRKVFVGRRGVIGKATAQTEADRLREQNPNKTYRVRKLPRRRT